MEGAAFRGASTRTVRENQSLTTTLTPRPIRGEGANGVPLLREAASMVGVEI
jgi:hypothetical protein